jgi:hypothetical protein
MHPDADGTPRWPDVMRRDAALSLLRSGVVALALVVSYFVLPMDRVNSLSVGLRLGLGLAAVAALLAWQVREIVRSPFPRAQAVGALAVSVPLFLIVFATTYYLLGQAAADNWTEPLSRLDALYFTVTVFATVGFGDIAASSPTTRAIVTLQMAGGLVLVGLIARVVVGAMQEGLRRRGTDDRT